MGTERQSVSDGLRAERAVSLSHMRMVSSMARRAYGGMSNVEMRLFLNGDTQFVKRQSDPRIVESGGGPHSRIVYLLVGGGRQMNEDLERLATLHQDIVAARSGSPTEKELWDYLGAARAGNLSAQAAVRGGTVARTRLHFSVTKRHRSTPSAPHSRPPDSS